MLVFLLYSHLSDILSAGFAAAASAAAVAAGLVFERLRLRAPAAVVMFAAAFILVRAVMFLVVRAVSGAVDSTVLDFFFFSFDSGFFPVFPAAVYLCFIFFMSARRPGFIPAEMIINSGIFCLLLWNQAHYNLTVFPHPGILTIFSILFFLVQVSILLFCFSADRKKTGLLSFLAAVVPLFLLTVFIIFGAYSEGASKDGGGLMQPTLFRFDFSDYVRLETEISMDNDLVLLLRNTGYLNSVYLRRFYLSGYKPERGFFVERGPGEAEQPLTVPAAQVTLRTESYEKRIESEQEYFIVNFDPSSLIAMNYPVSVSPLTNWHGSSFLRNYRVVSMTVEQPSWELPETPILSMSPELKNFYTEYGGDEEIRKLAEEVTEGLEMSYDKVVAIMFYLHDRYYYSLKPGVASDGNQLHHFLFETKKGYCSYFAFSMALMCRSIGIPARVAAGFFIDPQSGILNVYPVREDMAHAWVEVPFEGYGWIEFDPTTDRLAPGEELEFGTLDSSEYSSLVEEIFANDYTVETAGLRDDVTSGKSLIGSALRSVFRFFRLKPGLVILAVYLLYIAGFHLREIIRLRIGSFESRISACYRKSRRLSGVFGCGRRRGESVLEHAERAEKYFCEGFLRVAEVYLQSVFAAGMDARSRAEAFKVCITFKAGYRKLPVTKRLSAVLFPFLRFRMKKVPLGAVILVFSLMLMLSPRPAGAQSVDEAGEQARSYDAGTYLDLAGREQDAENYEAALKLLKEGISLFPDSWELHMAEGDLYADRELYNLALDQYEKALALDAGNPDILYQKSVAEGLLNLDEQSIKTLESLLGIVPDHYDALADLGWMYFKTFRLSKAEELLLGAVSIYSDSPILFMTLGTVYSGMYDYANAEKYYLQSINMAVEKGWNYFASVSYYNLSLLEHGFYNFDKALEYTDKSIETGERAPGYISRAEIFLGRMDFDTAFMNFEQAYTIDPTPLALMGQADLYLTFGLLDEALAHIQEVLKHGDDSWMYYFGVDPDRHRMETDRLLMDIYEGMTRRERFSPASGFGRFSSVLKMIRYKCLGWYHERRYRGASYNVGRSNELHGNLLDAAWAFYIANEDYEHAAGRYLLRSEQFETEVAPESKGSYLLERGRLERDSSLLLQAIEQLDPVWERLQISEALTELIRLNSRKQPAAAADFAARLYRINPGAFVREGLRFPLELDFKPGFLLKMNLRRSGFDISKNIDDYDYRYRLAAADKQDRGVLFSVVDSDSGEVLISIEVEDGLNSPAKISAFTAELKQRLFTISDGKDAPL